MSGTSEGPNLLMLNASILFLLQVSGLEMRKWVDELFIIIMDMLQDSSLLAKRQVRAHCLSAALISPESPETPAGAQKQ